MSTLTILFISDLCGRAGRQAAAHMTRDLKQEFEADYVIANVENAAGGFGITPEMSRKIFSYGVNLQTSGNHIWDRVDILDYMHDQPRLLRPANYPPGVPGNGFFVDEVGPVKIAVLNLMGRVYMNNIDCPFQVGMQEVKRLQEQTAVIFVDFHAEATSEKQALAFHLDGMVSAVIGTHTHVPTADEHVTRRGTAYITDAGMTGPYDSIIGMEKGPSLGRFITGMPKRFNTASDDVRLAGVVVKIDPESGQAISIERIMREFDIQKYQAKKPPEVE
jgi:metallophosphoesterase (TIGR00282 family)